jgi:hypothetical protein
MAKQNRSHRKLTQPWPAKAGYGKAGKQNPLSNFPTASTNTKYNYLWDTGSEGKVTQSQISSQYLLRFKYLDRRFQSFNKC